MIKAVHTRESKTRYANQFPLEPHWLRPAPQNCASMIHRITYNKHQCVATKKNGTLLTTPTATLRSIIFWFLQNCCLLTVRAPLLNAVAWCAMLSVLSTNNSILSPRLRICSTFWTMMSLTWESSPFARSISSRGGAVLYEFMRRAITGPKVPWRPWTGTSESEEEDGRARNWRWSSVKKANGRRLSRNTRS